MPEPIRIDVVTDIDAAWHELEPLYFGLHEHHLGLAPGRRLRPDWATTQRKALESTADSLLLIARAGGTPVGLADGLLRSHPIVEERFGYLNVAYVVPDQRGGLGRALYERFEAWCREMGVGEVRLRVETANALGMQVWEGLGFRPFAVEMVKAI
ncbi:MAG: GNAT family N-acetyltransferase [Chloroflexi bacterium]|nr:GNAT family N-acetyltransferase [Chloroflexota bacterium]